MITIDGSMGEGGGQILRTTLSLSLATGTPFHLRNIRAGREKPGLMRQHLTALKAAATIGQARVEGDSIGSRELTFIPGKVIPGDYHFAVGSAGSATLVLQTVLPALMTASAPSTLILEGGTHNPFAPPLDFLMKTFLPLVRRMGPEISVEVESLGFYPAGGGKFRIRIEPTASLSRLDLPERGEIRGRRARAVISMLPVEIAERELAIVQQMMSWEKSCLVVEEVRNSPGPGNVLFLEIESEWVTEVFVGFGTKGVRAEAVADQAVKAARRYLAAGVPVGEHLADQLLLPLAIAGGGSFVTLPLTRHARTNLEVLKLLLPIQVSEEQIGRDKWLIEVRR